MTDVKDILTADRVNAVFLDCLFREGEDFSHHIVAEGIVQTAWFHPGRVEQHSQDIHDMLAELPDEFKSSKGGGYSFLNACKDRYGRLWTGMHPTVEQLVQLGIATGEVEYCRPREEWASLPGGVPYFVVGQ